MPRPGPLVLTPEQQAIAGDPRHVRIARAIAREAARGRPDMADEIESQCLYALCRAAATWTPLPGGVFACYLRRRLAGAVLDAQRFEGPGGDPRSRRRHCPRCVRLPLRATCHQSGDSVVLAWDGIRDPRPAPCPVAEADALAALLRPLPANERAVLTAYYRDGLGLRAAGAAIGKGEVRACQLRASGLAALRERAEGGAA